MGKVSGRKYATVAIISTYCLVIIGSLVLTIMRIMELPVFLATVSGLGTLVMYITKAYFDDKDRSLENNGTK
jgi:uncharacterized membrane protein (UPF0136 family)